MYQGTIILSWSGVPKPGVDMQPLLKTPEDLSLYFKGDQSS